MESLNYYIKATRINLAYFSHKALHIPFYHLISKKVKILSDKETVDKIINEKISVTRFGDGEFELIFGRDLKFQKHNKEIADRLTEVLLSKKKNLLTCVNKKMFSKLNDKASINRSYRRMLTNHIYFFTNKFNLKYTYGEASFTRFYIDNPNKDKDYKKIGDYINKIKKIWENRDILIVEGELSRLGVGNNLFENTKSIKRILCPIKDAFSSYNEILSNTINNSKNGELVLIALGPTATILAHDLHEVGRQAIDIGHLDVEYMWFLNKEKEKVTIKGKYVNEARNKNFEYDFEEILLKDYRKQITKQI